MATVQTHQERSKARLAEREKLLGENETLQKNQAEMKRKATAAHAEVDRLNQSITTAAIAGKDFTNDQAQLQKIQSTLSVYEMAVEQSEKQIAENNFKAEEAEKNSRMATFEGEQEIAAVQLVEAYNAGKVFLEKRERVLQTFTSLERHGFKLLDFDEGRALQMFQNILSNESSSGGLQARLKQIETELFAVFEKARNK